MLRSLTALLVLVSVSAQAAGTPKRVEVRRDVERRSERRVERPADVREIGKSDRSDWTDARVSRMIEKSGARINDAQKAIIVEGAKNSIEIRQAVNTLDAAVAKLTESGARLSRSQGELVELSMEWLSLAKGQTDIYNIHMVFEDALKQGYSRSVAEGLREAIENARSGKMGLFEATKEAFERRGIKESDLLNCKKA